MAPAPFYTRCYMVPALCYISVTSCYWSCGHMTFLVVMWPFMWAYNHINIENNYLVSSSWLFWYAIWQIFDQFQLIMWPVMWSCDWSCGHLPRHMYLRNMKKWPSLIKLVISICDMTYFETISNYHVTGHVVMWRFW